MNQTNSNDRKSCEAVPEIGDILNGRVQENELNT